MIQSMDGNCVENMPMPLVGKWSLVGSIMTRLEINQDGSGSVVGSVWGVEPAAWSISGSRLTVMLERGDGSADYAISDNNELFLSNAYGILVGGTYKPTGEHPESYEAITW